MTYYRLEQIRGIDRCLEKVLAARREGSRRDRQLGHRSAPAGSCAAEWRSVLLYATPYNHRRVQQHPSETAATGPNTSVWNSNPCARAGYGNCQESEGRQVKPAALRRQSSRGLTTDKTLLRARTDHFSRKLSDAMSYKLSQLLWHML